MKIEKLMTPDVQSCSEAESLEQAARLMWDHDCGALPITDRGRVVGMITDRDVCMAAYTQGKTLREITVGSVMSRQVISCSPADELASAETKMREYRVRRLPVIERGKLVGILSLNDLATAMEHGSASRDGVSVDEVANTLASVCAHRLPVWTGPTSAEGQPAQSH